MLERLLTSVLRTGYARVLIGLLVDFGSGHTASAAVPPELAGTTWRWVRFASPTEDLSVSEPERYTLTFSATGWIKLRADCNHGAGGAVFPGPGLIQVDALALTHKMCPQGTLSAIFSSDITQAIRWYLRDGKLCLELPADAGVLWFGCAGILAWRAAQGALPAPDWASSTYPPPPHKIWEPLVPRCVPASGGTTPHGMPHSTAPTSRREKAALTTLAAPPTGKIYGYCRISTVAQADEGESLDVQQRQLSGYATRTGRCWWASSRTQR